MHTKTINPHKICIFINKKYFYMPLKDNYIFRNISLTSKHHNFSFFFQFGNQFGNVRDLS